MVGRPTLVGGAGNRTGFESLALCQLENSSINAGGERSKVGRGQQNTSPRANFRMGFESPSLCQPTQTSLLQTPNSSYPMPQGQPPLAFQKSATPHNRSVQSHLDTRENPHRPRPDQNAAYL